jgi:hypothetical protein
MTGAGEAWRRFDAPARRRMVLATVAALLVGFAAVTAWWWGYNRLVQYPACYAYAEEQGIGDAESLRVTDVRIATWDDAQHYCEFVDRRTGRPLRLDFAEEDIPRGRDYGQLASMIALAVLVIGVVSTRGARYVVDPRYARSAEDALARRERRR